MKMPDWKIICGDALEVLKKGKENSFQVVITSPPYFNLRLYSGGEKEIGTEKTLDVYIQNLVEVFREVKRVLQPDGIFWLNIGDRFNGSGGAGGDYNPGGWREGQPKYPGTNIAGLKPKDLCMIPARVALALQADGWWIRSDIIWYRPNPVPESVKDRVTRSYEHVFMLTKSPKYYYNIDSLREPHKESSLKRYRTGWNGDKKRDYSGGIQNNFDKWLGMSEEEIKNLPGRNKHDVWVIPTSPSRKNKHKASFPEALIEPMVLAGSKEGDWVLDMFCGSGTTGVVALKLNRRFIGIDLNQDYVDMSRNRIEKELAIMKETKIKK